MNYILNNKMKALIVAFSVIILGFFVGFLTASSSAIPYTGDATQSSPVPAFNVFTGVPSVGNESDFYKGKLDGSTADSVNNIESTCETGTRFSLRAYVHNGANQNANNDGNGPSVAKDTKVKMTVPTNEGSNFGSTATISSSNAGSISDNLTITCTDGRVVTVKYVIGSAEQFSGLSGVQPVSDSIVTTGAPIGTMSPNGDLWGCWDQRVWVRIVVEVTEVPEELHPAVCEAILTTLLSSNQIRVDDVEYNLRDATLNNIEIDFGDTTKNNVQPSDLPVSHTYANPGTFTIRATLNTTFEGSANAVTSVGCETKIEVEEEEKQVVACDNFSLTFNDRTATVMFVPTATNGATFENANIIYRANGSEVSSDTKDVVNSDGKVVSTYTFNKNAINVKADVTVRFNVTENDKQTIKEVKCSGEKVLGTSVTPPPTTPTTLPDTGAGSIAGIMVAISAVGAYAHRAFTLKRQ